jgi:hypothetical protein
MLEHDDLKLAVHLRNLLRRFWQRAQAYMQYTTNTLHSTNLWKSEHSGTSVRASIHGTAQIHATSSQSQHHQGQSQYCQLQAQACRRHHRKLSLPPPPHLRHLLLLLILTPPCRVQQAYSYAPCHCEPVSFFFSVVHLSRYQCPSASLTFHTFDAILSVVPTIIICSSTKRAEV